MRGITEIFRTAEIWRRPEGRPSLHIRQSLPGYYWSNVPLNVGLSLANLPVKLARDSWDKAYQNCLASQAPRSTFFCVLRVNFCVPNLRAA